MREVTLAEAYPYQRPWIDSQARFKVVCAGRRDGKTETLITMIVDGHGEGKFKGAMHGANLAWVAPSNKQARKLWRRLIRALGHCWQSKNETDRRLEFYGGGSIDILSAEAPIAALGDGYDGAAVDEARRISEHIWLETFRPMLSDRKGWAVFISTPGGEGNWFYRLFKRGQSPDSVDASWESWQSPSSDNPLLDQEEIDEAREDLGPILFAQEYMAQFVSADTTIFKPENLQLYTDDELPPRFGRVIQSWDCAFKDTKDSSYVVGQVWGVVGPTRYLLDQTRERMSFTRTIQAITSLKDRWPETQEVYVEDKANGSAVINVLKDKIERVLPVNPEGGKIARARAVSSLWEAGNIRIPAEASFTKRFVDEVTSFPNSANDDQVDAMTQALVKLKSANPRTKRKTREYQVASYAHLLDGGSL